MLEKETKNLRGNNFLKCQKAAAREQEISEAPIVLEVSFPKKVAFEER